MDQYAMLLMTRNDALRVGKELRYCHGNEIYNSSLHGFLDPESKMDHE
jgi:hypothetical protein